MGSGLQRAQAFMVLATMLYRASHLVVGVLAVVPDRLDEAIASLGLAAALLVSALVYGTALRNGWFDRRLVWADVLVIGCLLPLVVAAWSGTQEHGAFAWAMLLSTSSSAVAAIALPRPWIVVVVAVLVATNLPGYLVVGASPGVVTGHVNSLVWSALIAWFFWRYLCRQGRLLDDATERAVEAEAQKARYSERLEHHRALHDTVLATLTALAGGGIDGNDPQVRARCARDAAYLRRLVEQTSDRVPRREIGAALEEAIQAAESLGLRVTARFHDLPRIPPHAAGAMGDAVGEALNNVHRHAGTGHAYVTAAGQPDGGDGVTVTVVDRGAGFDPERYMPGLGLRSSVHGRMTEAGGTALVEGVPDEGVRVELRWPA
ncbi:sensor histidine kinase [Streptomyces sp. 184]|uniref:sensor histidine kinase n=1 Tax=Streptomyces sp. 184 TaxID=1827526 RepID=UPI0038928658